MTPSQIRALVMCKIRFYQASVSATHFSDLLERCGWRRHPDFEKAGIVQLESLEKRLRQMLRS